MHLIDGQSRFLAKTIASIGRKYRYSGILNYGRKGFLFRYTLPDCRLIILLGSISCKSGEVLDCRGGLWRSAKSAVLILKQD